MVTGENGQLTFLDILNIMSFIIGIENLNANLDQNDKSDLQRDLSEKADMLLKEIHAHLKAQDKKLDELLKEVKKIENHQETVRND